MWWSQVGDEVGLRDLLVVSPVNLTSVARASMETPLSTSTGAAANTNEEEQVMCIPALHCRQWSGSCCVLPQT